VPSYQGDALMENRNGLSVAADASLSSNDAERHVALKMLRGNSWTDSKFYRKVEESRTDGNGPNEKAKSDVYPMHFFLGSFPSGHYFSTRGKRLRQVVEQNSGDRRKSGDRRD
jgi:hypothetical protein